MKQLEFDFKERRRVMIVGKSFKFDSAHYLPGHNKCGEIHGHTYTLEVRVKGEVNKDGMVMDLHELKEIIERIIKPFDHQLLNEFISNPTCENLSWLIFKAVKSELAEGLTLESIKVQEGGGGYAICKG